MSEHNGVEQAHSEALTDDELVHVAGGNVIISPPPFPNEK
jgi:hypothetical protein